MNARSDVVIAGAGVAGLSAAVALARAGVRVVCIDPERPPRARVGESLDWSVPGLLAQLGLPRDELVAAGVGTYKRQVRAVTPSGDLMVGRPRSWLHWWPLRFEHVTLHLDRQRFDELLYEKARSASVTFVWDHVTDIRFDGDRIVGFGTRSGRWFAGDWFIDAAGRRRLIARTAGIDRDEWGVPRISLWSHCDAAMGFEGTMLHLNGRSDDLTWAWEIPISAHRQSVGVVMPLSRFQSLRRTGRSLAEVLVDELARFPRFPAVSPSRLETVRTRTYRPFVSTRVTGANWLMIGEAAAFADPITSIGMTMAMRHASEAAELIIDNADSPAGAEQELSTYDRRVRDVAGLYNLGVETLMYGPLLRRAFGIRWASRAYVPLGYLTNSLYTRLKPVTRSRMTALGLVLGVLRLWVQTWLVIARLIPPVRQQSSKDRPRIRSIR
jgi:flavin-dependent dehydrogenase